MRLIGLILSASLLIACLGINAYGMDPTGVTLQEGESLADKLIEGSNSAGVYKPNTGMAPTPDASKKEWANRTGVDFTMPDSLSGTGKSAKEARANAEAANDKQTDDSASTQAAQTTTPTAEDTIANSDTSSSAATSVGGSWSFTLDESTPREMALTLFQSGDAVFGTGSMNTGDSTLVVAAAGSVDGNSVNLDVTSIGTIGLYRMALNLDGESASGSYKGFDVSGEAWEGNVQGERSVAG